MPKAYVFLTDEEKKLVNSKFDISNTLYDVMGVGVDIPKVISEEDFRNKYKLNNFLIYVGRIDQGKDCPRLFEYFIEYKKRNTNNLKLVLMGKAVISIPKHPDIINLGFVTDEDKFNGIKASKALVLPSKYESLSISVLEAMSLSKPVIVNGLCEVLKGHCIKSNGGLYYKNYFEFEGCINYLLSQENKYKDLCENAKQYIEEYFQWDIIVEKFKKLIDKICTNYN
ncbi:UDP-D-galactose:(glucosyl)lipopolysaccharide-1, 6-D-galactosyltransferase [Clostridium sp. C105KSO15]|nr:UDP-D-galactose:(glucosyl)lipopolysaccharide-1, 6-D-galactosyltransferase [Clostridium sp. C105KSO15]